MSTGGRIAVCPGTYDPVTYGHLDVIERAARLFDRVVVSIAEGSHTKQPMFTAEERKALLRQSVEHLGNVEVVGFNSLVTTHAREGCADSRGLRLRKPDDPVQPGVGGGDRHGPPSGITRVGLPLEFRRPRGRRVGCFC